MVFPSKSIIGKGNKIHKKENHVKLTNIQRSEWNLPWKSYLKQLIAHKVLSSWFPQKVLVSKCLLFRFESCWALLIFLMLLIEEYWNNNILVFTIHLVKTYTVLNVNCKKWLFAFCLYWIIPENYWEFLRIIPENYWSYTLWQVQGGRGFQLQT